MPCRTHLLALTLVAFLAACSGDAAPGADDTTAAATARQAGGSTTIDADLADIANYRLTMPKIDQWMQAQRNVARAAAALSPAERAAFRARQDEGNDADRSTADMVRRIESDPLMSRAVRDAGLTASEFTLITMSVIQSGMAAAVLEMRPNDDQDSLVREMKANMENVRFMRANRQEIERKRKAMEAELRAAGIDPEADEDEGEEGAGDY